MLKRRVVGAGLRTMVVATSAAWLAAACRSQHAPKMTPDPGPTSDGGDVGATSDGGDGGTDGGTTVIPPPTDALICDVTTYSATRIPIEILLVADRSLSMGDAPASGQPSKWSQVVSAIEAMTAADLPMVQWGLKLAGDGSDACGVDGSPAVPLASKNAGAIDDALAASGGPRGGAPIAAAVTAAGAYLASFASTGPKYIVLITDGRPTCANGDATATDTSAAIQAITDQFQSGIGTFVVGVPTEGDAGAAAILEQMAIAGGHAAGQTPGYVPIAHAADLVTPLLPASPSSCTFALPSVPPVPENIRVQLNGSNVPRDATDGWEYGGPNMTTIVLAGSSYDRVRDETATSTTLTILFGCPSGGPLP